MKFSSSRMSPRQSAFYQRCLVQIKSVVGSRNGAVPLGPIYPFLSVSSRSASRTEPYLVPTPPRRTERADFPHSALLLASQEDLWDVANWWCCQMLISHQHLLHSRQPLPSSSSCISSSSGLADCRAFLSDAPASHHCQKNYETAGSLRSLGIPPVHRYFDPFRPLLAFLPFPGSAGYRSALLQSLSLWDEEGFPSCVPCPCYRAAPPPPP